MEIDSATTQTLNKLEEICKDRFSGYAFVVMDGDNVYSCFSSAVMAKGAASYIKHVVKEKWNCRDV
mgnify:CR=1 FL=1